MTECGRWGIIANDEIHEKGAHLIFSKKSNTNVVLDRRRREEKKRHTTPILFYTTSSFLSLFSVSTYSLALSIVFFLLFRDRKVLQKKKKNFAIKNCHKVNRVWNILSVCFFFDEGTTALQEEYQ